MMPPLEDPPTSAAGTAIAVVLILAIIGVVPQIMGLTWPWW